MQTNNQKNPEYALRKQLKGEKMETRWYFLFAFVFLWRNFQKGSFEARYQAKHIPKTYLRKKWGLTLPGRDHFPQDKIRADSCKNFCPFNPTDAVIRSIAERRGENKNERTERLGDAWLLLNAVFEIAADSGRNSTEAALD